MDDEIRHAFGRGHRVIHDRNPLFVALSSGEIRNAYTVRFSNMAAQSRRLTLEVQGLPGSRIEIVGEARVRRRGARNAGPGTGPDARNAPARVQRRAEHGRQFDPARLRPDGRKGQDCRFGEGLFPRTLRRPRCRPHFRPPGAIRPRRLKTAGASSPACTSCCILIAFFVLGLGANGVMIYYALSTFSGEVAKKPYEQGLAFNNEMKAGA